jgi:hypothetical protein
MVERREEITVVHLARAANGPAPLDRFVDSYRSFTSGAPHALRIIAKGFTSPADVTASCERLGHQYVITCVSDAGMDVGAYLGSVELVTTEFVCFLNSFSELRADGWLALLLAAARGQRVGVAGASGSYESALSIVGAGTLGELGRTLRRPRSWLSTARELWRYGSRFPRFPNAHLRSNAFLIRSDLFRLMHLRGPDKLSALEFESGYRSMTRVVQRRGLQPVVVGADGRTFGADAWPASGTFRSGDQGNLLVHDNQTRRYQAADARERERLGRLAWGAQYRA